VSSFEVRELSFSTEEGFPHELLSWKKKNLFVRLAITLSFQNTFIPHTT
jgi:hypothetical protein